MFTYSFFISWIFLFIPSVFADDIKEYSLVINNSNVPTLRRVDGDNYIEVTNSTEKSQVFTLEEIDNKQVLTLNEGIHYAYIQSDIYGELIIKAPNFVYVNRLYGNWITLDTYNSTSYVSTSTHEFDAASPGLKTHFNLGHFSMKNSTLRLLDGTFINQDVIHTYITPNFDENESITLDNSIIETKSVIFTPSKRKIIIKNNSKVYAYGIGIESDNDNTNLEINIKNSYIELISNKVETLENQPIGSFIYCMNDIVIENSELRTNGSIYGADLTIKNATVDIKDGVEKFYFPASNTMTVLIENASVKLNGPVIVASSLTLRNAYIEAESGASEAVKNKELNSTNDYNYRSYSAYLVYSLSLYNSNIRGKTDDSVPAFAILNSFYSNDTSTVFIDNNSKNADFEKVDKTEAGFFKKHNNFNANEITFTSFNTPTEIYTAHLFDVPLTEGATSPSEVITLKIKNGTWEDGSDNDLEIKSVKGTIITKDYIENISLIDNGKLILT